MIKNPYNDIYDDTISVPKSYSLNLDYRNFRYVAFSKTFYIPAKRVIHRLLSNKIIYPHEITVMGKEFNVPFRYIGSRVEREEHVYNMELDEFSLLMKRLYGTLLIVNGTIREVTDV